MPQFDTHFFSSLIFWEFLSFGILFLVLWKYAFPPILQTLDERERKIKESLEQADRHRAEAEQKMQEYEAKLKTASKEAETVLAAAKDRAQRIMEENEQRLRTETQRSKEDAAREIDQERRRAIQDIRNQTTEMALLVAEKVVGRSLNDADHKRMADEALSAVAESRKG
ncbi:MAG: ATP synthase F0 subunit B [Nitrospirae bacterium RIFCSPLOWO2_01_FULL_62_17]|nr:MAG: ATP synthase F0 subunit B [Nitrospirae bacterium RIFCSPLOWO2_01_FULL_62_17]